MDYGIDVSNFNTIADWAAVRGAGISFASVLLTQGNYFTSHTGPDQVAGARAANVVPGGYHFADPGVTVAANVDRFVGRATETGVLKPGSFLPMLDVENDPGEGIVWTAASANTFIRNWIPAFRKASGVQQVLIYANLSFWQTLLRPDEWADDDTYLWLALYNGSPGDTGGFSHRRLALHQHTSQGLVAGSQGPLDRDVTVGGFGLADLLIGDTMSWSEDLTAEFVQQLPAKLLATPVSNPEYDESITDPNDPRSHATYTFGDWLVNSNLKAGRSQAISMAALAAVQTLATAQGADPEALTALIEQAVDKALAGAVITVTTSTPEREDQPEAGTP
jgi:GH25 family lysozyme M1 (1,4-beta-N-acetylmuramidase)